MEQPTQPDVIRTIVDDKGRTVTFLAMEYDPSPPPPLKLRAVQPPPEDCYDAVASIDAYSGITRWKDGQVTRWSGVSRKATFNPEVQSSPEWAKWRARVQSYWGSHKYECQVCGLDRDKYGILQRPVGVNDGPIKVYPATGVWGDGDEPDDELLALCDPCAKETSELAYEYRTQDWGSMVRRLQGKRKRLERRRRDLISNQAKERVHRRARKQQWRDEIARRKQAGIILDAEFQAEYADVYRPL